MTDEYRDKNGTIVKVGDILKYDEGDGYAKGLHEVIDIDGELHGVTRIGYPKWSEIDDEPIHLRHYTLLGYRDKHDYDLVDAVIIGNIYDNPEMLTVEYAENLWPIK